MTPRQESLKGKWTGGFAGETNLKCMGGKETMWKINHFLQKAPTFCSYSLDMSTAGKRRAEHWALQCGWTEIVLMQLFSFSVFSVNSPHNDTQSTAGISWAVAPTWGHHWPKALVLWILDSWKSSLSTWVNHFLVLSGSAPNPWAKHLQKSLLPPQSSPPMAHRVTSFTGLLVRVKKAATLHSHTHIFVLC